MNFDVKYIYLFIYNLNTLKIRYLYIFIHNILEFLDFKKNNIISVNSVEE